MDEKEKGIEVSLEQALIQLAESLGFHETEEMKSIKERLLSLNNPEDFIEVMGEYQKLSGSNEIDTGDGEVREIIYVAKLVT